MENQDNKPTGGVLFSCSKCGLNATSQKQINELGGTIDWKSSSIKVAGWDA